MEINYESRIRRSLRWRKKFALLPARIDDTRLVWLEYYWVRWNSSNTYSDTWPYERQLTDPYQLQGEMK